MDTLKQIVREVVTGYAGKVLNGYSYLTHNDDDTVYTVVDVARLKQQHVSGVSLVVRIAGDKVVIERDQNDKPLVDALVQADVSREDIILAYAGEPVPELIL
jgi:XisI protein